MRLIKHLKINEVLSLDDRDILKHLWKILNNDCGEYLKELKKSDKGGFLFRGSNNIIKTFKRIEPRKDRRPTDMPEKLHNYIDELFKKKFGWRPRSEGVFVIGSHNISANYGKPGIFFPSNKYKFLWNKDIDDLYGSAESEGYDIDIFEPMEYEYDEEYGIDSGNGTWYYEGYDTQESDYYSAIEWAENEYGEKYSEYSLAWSPNESFNDWSMQKINEWEFEKNEEIKNWIRKYQDRNLKQAIKSKNEIMFKCNFYYLVNPIFELELYKLIWK